ncbi:MAG: FkbM family methyltransferase [Patescibacteria group bacterium]|nr:FkbM family methyltransferase [Patescibacteria group bacterium]MDE2116368.1 FkbM family methyltransferase [Patescibacteria group bacterium]
MSIAMKIKKLANKFGYDVKKHRPFYEDIVMPLGIRTIIDVGANTGRYAHEMRGLFPSARIYSFEPLKECFAELEDEMAGDPLFKAYNIALGETEGEFVIQKSSFHPSSSLLAMSDIHKKLYPKSRHSQPETIRVMRLDDALADEKLEDNILIKMDVQGFEDKVIGGGRATVGRAAIAVIETSYVPLYEGQPLFDDIYRLMTGLGFSYYGDAHRHHDKTGKLIYEDSVYIKKSLLGTLDIAA